MRERVKDEMTRLPSDYFTWRTERVALMCLLYTDYKEVSASINILSCVQIFALATTDYEIPNNLSDRAVMIPYEDECWREVLVASRIDGIRESRYGWRERRVEK